MAGVTIRMDKHKNTLTIILWIATGLWVCLCLFLAWQQGEGTSRLSIWIATLAQRLLGLMGIELDVNTINMWLRKCAHVAVFLVLGLLFYFSIRRSLPQSRYVSVISFVTTAGVCSACAVMAEVVKLWIPGRHLQWDETALDVAGVVCGAAVAALVQSLLCHISARPGKQGSQDR